MKFKTSLLRAKAMARPSDRMKTQYWWHGTDQRGAKAILKAGLRKDEFIDSYEEGDFAPQDGRVYLASSVRQAMCYSMDRTRYTDPNNRKIYLFRIPGSNLNDVTLDEDAIARAMDFRYGAVRLDSYSLNPSFDKQSAKKIEDIINTWIKANPYMEPEARDNETVIIWAKEVMHTLPETLIQEIAEIWGSSVTSDGIVWPDMLYTIKLPETYDCMLNGENIKDLFARSIVKSQPVRKRAGMGAKTSLLTRTAHPQQGDTDWQDAKIQVGGREFRLGDCVGGKLYHGTGVVLDPGSILTSGYTQNFRQSPAGLVCLTSDPARAHFWARKSGVSTPHVYEVEPLTPIIPHRVGLASQGKSFVLWEGRVGQARILREVGPGASDSPNDSNITASGPSSDAAPPALIQHAPKSPRGAVPALVSWYGSECQGKETASSGRKSVPPDFWTFDRNQFTCAHWTAPLGSKVKVRVGDKAVVLMVTDRGPHPRLKRDYDLTERAARYLGYKDTGLANATVQEVSRATPLGPASAT